MSKPIFVLILLFLILISPVSAGPAASINPRTEPMLTPLPALAEEINIPEWYVIGPFLSGSREPLADPFAGAYHPLDSSGIPDLNARYPSTLEFGRDVGWKRIPVDDKGSLNVKFENVNWDKIDDEWGVSGISYTGAAYTTFVSHQKCRALADAQGIGGFILNGVVYSGDPYGHGLIKTPVILKEGVNHILFYFGGYGGEKSISFKLEPPPSEVMVLERDILLPDVVRGESLKDAWAGIPVLNTTDVWLKDMALQVEWAIGTNPIKVNIPPLAPLSVIKIPIDVSFTDPFPGDWEGDKVDFKISVKHPCGETQAVANARVRKPDDSRIVTFKSYIDNSAQKYAIHYPLNYKPDKFYSLILTLHGAGVECEGLVDAYQPKDWAFIVAPTNRRRFGFDWQDWGRLDALEVLNNAKANYPIDENRIYLVGHSMGGHGTWHIGCTDADQFAAIVPSAGWASFQLYVPWYLRQDEIFGDPDCMRIFDAAAAPDRTELLLPNLRNTPVLAVQGGDDDDVPPTHARLLTGMLDKMGYQAGYWEVPKMGHWWDATPDIPGTDCVDADRIMNFLQNNVRNPYPDHVTFVSYDLGNSNSMYWVRVEEATNPIRKVEVDAILKAGEEIECTTTNVTRLCFSLDGLSTESLPKRIKIDDQLIDVSGVSLKDLFFIRDFNKKWFQRCFMHELEGDRSRWKGPIKRAFFEPFLIVAGTTGSDSDNALNMEVARNIAFRWWYRANGYARIVNDYEVTEADKEKYNLILIGAPCLNSICNEMIKRIPVGIEENGILWFNDYIPGSDMAVQLILPSTKYNRVVLCEFGTSQEGMRLAAALTPLYSGSDLPDFLIYDKEVKLKGYAGVRLAGFWGYDWSFNEDWYYIDK